MTPLDKFGEVYLKREDKNITGSAKDRAIPLQVENLIKLGFTKAAISSSGNAAISAGYYCSQNHIHLTAFLSPKTSKSKLKLISANFIAITDTPISDAFKFSKNNAYFLRQSTDSIAMIGYQSIATELLVQCPQISSIFIPVGSGTTLLGISKILPSSVKIFAVQPASHCPIASHFDNNFIPESQTKTDALSVKFLPLKNEVISACYSGIVVQDDDISNEINASAEANLAFAGYQKAKITHDVGNFPVILVTGAKR